MAALVRKVCTHEVLVGLTRFSRLENCKQIHLHIPVKKRGHFDQNQQSQDAASDTSPSRMS
jgi:hypothetical protein